MRSFRTSMESGNAVAVERRAAQQHQARMQAHLPPDAGAQQAQQAQQAQLVQPRQQEAAAQQAAVAGQAVAVAGDLN